MKIRIIPHGPYEVTGNIPLNQISIQADTNGYSEGWGQRKNMAVQGEPYHLCRCGKSSTRPFCDGSHVSIRFQGVEMADKRSYKKQAVLYEGQAVNLLDQETLCAVARFCERGETIWSYVQHSGNPAYKKLAIYEAHMCPSGRLTIVSKKGKQMEPKLECEIALIQDPARGCRGPIWVKGGIPVEGADGHLYETRNQITLCRCGASKNHPFCDASHLNSKHMQGRYE